MFARTRKLLWRPDSLRERAINASLWNVFAMVVRYPLRLASNLVMTQILAPEAFGLMATVLSLHIGLSLFSDVGILQSVMRSPRGDTPRFLRTAWVVQILRGALIAGILVLIGAAVDVLGPRLAGAETVYADPRLPGLIWLTSLALLAAGFQSTCIMLARRRMQLGRVIVIESLSQVVSLTAMIGLGLATRSVWALASGMVVGSIATSLLSHALLSGPRMRLSWDRAQTAEMWLFGKWLIGASLGGYLLNNGDRLIFAALIDKSVFGIYAIAALWTDVGTQLIARTSQSIFMPSFRSVLSTRPHDINRFLTSASVKFLVFTIVTSVSTAAVASIMLLTLYDTTYRYSAVIVILLLGKNLLRYFSVIKEFVVFSGDSRHSAISHLTGAALSWLAIYAAFANLGFEWSIVVFALGSAPVSAMFLLQPKLRLYLNIRVQFLLLMAIVAVYVGVAAEFVSA